MQRGRSLKQTAWAVAGIIVQERSAAQQLVLEVGEFCARGRLPTIIPAANAQGDAISFWYDDRGRPDLDGEIDGSARLQRLHLVMAVIGPVSQRQGFVELAVRGAQPALRH